VRRVSFTVLLLAALPALAQHDISRVEPVGPDAALATPIPLEQQRKLKKYDLLEMSGAKQALGPQLIDGRLPKPLIDYVVVDAHIEQRVSIFEGGLVVVKMSGAASIQKKVILPEDALVSYTRTISADSVRAIDNRSLPPPEATRRALLRVYAADGTYVERTFHPDRVPSKALNDQVAPMRDLLRAVSEDRGVTTSIAGYEPKPGDELVADDHKVYRVQRIVDGAGVVELKCLDAPTTIYIAKKDLHLYFIGANKRDE
jgi:hypothetical protein